jgi:hypothetical protein
MSESINLVRKIVPRIVMESDIEKPKSATNLYSLIGVANRVATGESDYGPWTKLVGAFEAQRVKDGARFQAPVCFLPEPFHSLVVQRVQAEIEASTQYETDDAGKPVMKDGHPVVAREGRAAVQFAVIVGLKPSARKGGVGYEFTVSPVVQPSASDALLGLREQVMKALPAPTA